MLIGPSSQWRILKCTRNFECAMRVKKHLLRFSDGRHMIKHVIYYIREICNAMEVDLMNATFRDNPGIY